MFGRGWGGRAARIVQEEGSSPEQSRAVQYDTVQYSPVVDPVSTHAVRIEREGYKRSS